MLHSKRIFNQPRGEKMQIAKLFFVRHGHTRYTGILPDLTEKGVETIKHSGKTILKRLGDYYCESLAIHSSPAPRAIGSAQILKEMISAEEGIIKIVDILRPMEILDQAFVAAFFKEYDGVNIDFFKEKAFADGKHVEPRQNVGKRFWTYWHNVCDAAIKENSQNIVITVAHYELFAWVLQFFHTEDQGKNLNYGEVIEITLTKIENETSIIVVIVFRDKQAHGIYNPVKNRWC